MEDKFRTDSTEPPDVKIAPEGMPWETITSIVGTVKRWPVLAAHPGKPGMYRAACWDGKLVVCPDDLGPGEAEALKQLREFMRPKPDGLGS